MSTPVAAVYEFGPFRLNPAAGSLYRDGVLIALPPKVIDVLVLLVRHKGETVAKESFFEAIWPDNFVEEANLTQSIFVLRKAFRDHGGLDTYIETIPKRGYRFAIPVRELGSEVESPARELPPAALESSQNGSNRRRFVWLAAGAGASAAAVVASILRPRSPISQRHPLALSVLPFKNISGDGGQEFLADGLTDSLTGELGRIRSLRVRSRTSAMRHKNSTRTLRDIASDLGVTAVVEGSVVRTGDRVRVLCKLIDTGEDTLLWSETYERSVHEIPRLMGEIASQVAEEFRLKLSVEEERRLSKDVSTRGNAFEAYLRGRYFLDRLASVPKAIEHFKAALQDDDRFAPAYVGLADCYGNLGAVEIGAYHPREARALAIGAARQALAVDPDSADACASLGRSYLFDWEWAESDRLVRKALHLNPSCLAARITSSQRLLATRRFAEGLRELEIARELDPLSLTTQSSYAGALRISGRYGEAIASGKRLIAAEPENAGFRSQLGKAYLQAGQPKLSIEMFESAVRLAKGNFTILGFQAQAYAAAGERAKAVAILNDLLALKRRQYVTPCLLALINLSLNNRNEFFHWFERAFQERASGMLWTKVDTLYNSMRPDPRFRKIESGIFGFA